MGCKLHFIVNTTLEKTQVSYTDYIIALKKILNKIIITHQLPAQEVLSNLFHATTQGSQILTISIITFAFTCKKRAEARLQKKISKLFNLPVNIYIRICKEEK